MVFGRSENRDKSGLAHPLFYDGRMECLNLESYCCQPHKIILAAFN